MCSVLRLSPGSPTQLGVSPVAKVVSQGTRSHHVPSVHSSDPTQDKKDPVNDEELRRNKVTTKIQKRSNPFIGKIEEGELKRLEPTAY